MNLDIFTVEEENLCAIFDISSREACISEIRAAMPEFDEPEMGELAEIVLAKLEAMTDAEFSEIAFNPAYDNDDAD